MADGPSMPLSETLPALAATVARIDTTSANIAMRLIGEPTVANSAALQSAGGGTRPVNPAGAVGEVHELLDRLASIEHRLERIANRL